MKLSNLIFGIGDGDLVGEEYPIVFISHKDKWEESEEISDYIEVEYHEQLYDIGLTETQEGIFVQMYDNSVMYDKDDLKEIMINAGLIYNPNFENKSNELFDEDDYDFEDDDVFDKDDDDDFSDFIIEIDE